MDIARDKRHILRFVVWFFIANGLLFCLIGFVYLYKILSAESLFNNLIINYSSYSAKLFILVFAVVNYLTYMILLAFIPGIIVLLVGYFLPYKRFIWILCLSLASLSLAFLVMNDYVFWIFKFHLDFSILELIFGGYWMDVFDLSKTEAIFLYISLASIGILEIAVAWLVWKKIILAESLLYEKTLFLFWFGGFLLSYFALSCSIVSNNTLLMQQTPNLPWYNQLMSNLVPHKNVSEILYRNGEEHFYQASFSNAQLSYPLHTMKCTKPDSPVNIIMIMVDSLRFDSLQKQLMPQLFRFAEKSWWFQKYFSGGNGTQPGLFSFFYSIPVNYWTAALKQHVPPVFTQLLSDYGYVTKVMWSNTLFVPPFDKTIFSTISAKDLSVSSGDDVANKDREITKAALNFLSQADKKQPFFLHLFYDALHAYCRDPSFPTPYKPVISKCIRIARGSATDPLPYYNRYLNSVAFIDEQLGELLTAIEALGYLKNSVVLVSSDHGEEFNDNQENYWGHTSNFSKFQLQVPLIIHWPEQKPGHIQYLTTSYDVMPTLLKHIFHCQNKVIDYSIGQDLLDKNNRLPFVLAGSYSNMGLAEKDRITTFRTSGGITVSDLNAKLMPHVRPQKEHVVKALELMRLYYAKSGS